MSCLDDNQISAFVGGSLSSDAAASVAAHLETCAACRQLVAALMRSERPDVTPSQAAHTAPTTNDPAPSIGNRLGRYVVLETLGSGGMGVVYAAYDPLLERKVAVKVVRARGSKVAMQEVTARLLREGKIIARLSHPNIVTVFDMSATDDQVFIAMELVAGGSLKRWLKAQPRSWRDILDVFLAAAEGLAAAHREGLVHRDLKPENILLGNDGRARVTDFGLAGSTESPLPLLSTVPFLESPGDGRLTRDGALVGTPAYMAPEQFAGTGADALSDQFSFCVSLWEALFGTRPFITTAQSANWKWVNPPSTAVVPAWVERVLRQGLSIDPAARFADMSALVKALSTDPDRLRKQRIAFASGAVVLAGLLAGALFWGSTRSNRLCTGAPALVEAVWNPQVAASLSSAFAKSGLPHAEANWALAQRGLDEYMHDWAQMHTEACSATRVRGEQSDQILGLRMGCLERRRREVRALLEVFKTADAEVASKAPSAVDAIVPIGVCADNEALVAQRPMPETPELQTKVAVVSAKLEAAKAQLDTGRYQDALRQATEAVTASKALAYPPMYAEALLLLGRLQEHTGELNAAEQTLLEAISAAEAGRHDAVTAEAATHLMLVLGARQTRYGEAHAWGKLASGAISRLGNSPTVLARLFQAEGLIAYAEGKLDQAIDFHQRAVALLEKHEPNSLTLAEALNSLGAAYRGGRDSIRALEAYQRALVIFSKRAGEGSDLTASAQNGLANAYMLEGRFDDALVLYKMAVATFEKVLGPGHPRTVTTINNIGVALAEQRKLDEALEYFERVLATREGQSKTSDKTADAHANVGMLLLELGRDHEAERQFDAAQAILQGQPLDSFSRAEPLLGMAKLKLKRKQAQQAIVLLESVLALCGDKQGFRFDNTRARASFLLGWALWEGPQKKAEGRALAIKARDAFESFGRKRFHRDLEEVEQWLVAHPAL